MHQGEAELVAEVHQQVEHLRLHRDVECADGLVGVQDRRVRPTAHRAIPMRCSCPPESWCGNRGSTSRPRPTRSSARDQLVFVRCCDPRNARIGSLSDRRTVILGSSERRGFWNTIWFRRRSSIASRPGAREMSRPSKRTVPRW